MVCGLLNPLGEIHYTIHNKEKAIANGWKLQHIIQGIGT